MLTNAGKKMCVLGWLACLTVGLVTACGAGDGDLTAARATTYHLQSQALESAGNAAPSDANPSPVSALDDDAGAPEPGENKCEGFPLEGKCAVEDGVSGRHLCASMIGVRFYPCPDGWTCRRDGDFLGCLPN